MKKPANLTGAYALQTPDDSKTLYRDWAKTYDRDFISDHGYVLHQKVAEAYAIAGGADNILDLGAGTGAVGDALRTLGYSDIHATDISPDMLAVARQKRIYQSLFEGNILERLDRPAGSFAGIVSAGTFTLGHVGPDGFDEILRLLAPGGLAVISVRDAHYESAGFAAKIAKSEPFLAKSALLQVRIYEESASGDHKDDRAVLVHMTKA